MSSPPVTRTTYASVADVEALMGAPVDGTRTTTLLELAADMIDAYNPNVAAMVPVPPAARVVNANMVVRVLANPLGVKSEQLASYSTSYGEAVAGMALSQSDMEMLDAIGGVGGMRVFDIQTPSSQQFAFDYWTPWWGIGNVPPEEIVDP